jgi:hypothetical protein
MHMQQEQPTAPSSTATIEHHNSKCTVQDINPRIYTPQALLPTFLNTISYSKGDQNNSHKQKRHKETIKWMIPGGKPTTDLDPLSFARFKMCLKQLSDSMHKEEGNHRKKWGEHITPPSYSHRATRLHPILKLQPPPSFQNVSWQAPPITGCQVDNSCHVTVFIEFLYVCHVM